MDKMKNKKLMTNDEISQAILNNYEANVKYKRESRAIIEYFSKNYCIPNDIEWLSDSLKEYKTWRLSKAVSELKALGYLKACAIDCSKTYNRKDSWKLTNRGTRLAKALLGIDKTKGSSSARKAQSCCRNRNVAEMMFNDVLDNENKFVCGDYLPKNLSIDSAAPFRGTSIAGYLLTTEGNYLVYSLNRTNIPVKDEKEIMSLRQVEALNGSEQRKTDGDYREYFDRIIIVDGLKAVESIFNTRAYTKWFEKDEKKYAKDYRNGLFYPEETLARGKAFLLHRSITQKETIPLLYNTPHKVLLTTDKTITQAVNEHPEKFGTPVEGKKYFHSTLETDKYVIVNLITQELHRMSLINDILENEEEKRNVLIYTTDKQKDFVKSCYKKNKKQILIMSVNEEVIKKQIEIMR